MCDGTDRKCGLTSNFQQPHLVWGRKKFWISPTVVLLASRAAGSPLALIPSHTLLLMIYNRGLICNCSSEQNPLCVCTNPPASFCYRKGWDVSRGADSQPLTANPMSQAGAEVQQCKLLEIMDLPEPFLEQRSNTDKKNAVLHMDRQIDIQPVQLWKCRLWSLAKNSNYILQCEDYACSIENTTGVIRKYHCFLSDLYFWMKSVPTVKVWWTVGAIRDLSPKVTVSVCLQTPTEWHLAVTYLLLSLLHCLCKHCCALLHIWLVLQTVKTEDKRLSACYKKSEMLPRQREEQGNSVKRAKFLFTATKKVVAFWPQHQ